MAEQKQELAGQTYGDTDSLVKATIALDTIYLSKIKVIHNLDAVDMNMQKLVQMKKVFMGLLIFAVCALALNVLLIVLMTYWEFKDLIDLVNNNETATPGAPGGLATAFTVKFPVLAKVMGFIGSDYAIALEFFLKDPSLNSYFYGNEATIMQFMWSMYYYGGGCGQGTIPVGIPGPSMLICCALNYIDNGQPPNIALCSAPCNPYSGNSPYSWAQDGISSAMNGAMMGMDMGGPPGALIGALISTGITLGMKAYSNSQTTFPPCIS